MHLVIKALQEQDPDLAACILQLSNWEANYKTGSELFPLYQAACDFAADIIVFRFVENCPWRDLDKEAFYREYGAFLEYLNGNGKAKIILTTGFWKHPADEVIMQVGKDRNLTTVYLGDLGEDESMKAIGLYAHSGVANHPGDKGMRAIADRIVRAIK